MLTNKPNEILTRSKSWIANFVIHHELCPFAHVSYRANSISYLISEHSDIRLLLEDFYTMCQELSSHSNISNSFLIIPLAADFDDILTLKQVADDFLEASELQEDFQTVAFHPLFVFEGEQLDAPGNFVNRSPYPMLHILRVQEVSDALGSIDDPDSIAVINKTKLEKLGFDYLSTSLQKLMD